MMNSPTRRTMLTPSVQSSFTKYVRSLVSVIGDFGNPFEAVSTDLVVLNTKKIADHAAVETVKTAKRMGQDQFNKFSRECLIGRSKPITDPIHRNNLRLFKGSTEAVRQTTGSFTHKLPEQKWES